jgi:phage tail sheath protein FI
MDHDRRFTAAFTGSRLAAQLYAGASSLEAAWRNSAARRATRVVAACLADRRSGAATMAVAATVALAAQQLRATPEPAQWMLPAFVLIWAAGNLLWARGRG